MKNSILCSITMNTIYISHPCKEVLLAHYRPQTKIVKVMFPQVSVYPQRVGRGASVSVQGGGFCPGGSLLGGLCPGVVSVRGGLSGAWGLYLERGVSVRGGGLCSGVSVWRGLCPREGSLSRGVSVQEGVSVQGGLLSRAGSLSRGSVIETPLTVMSGRYASYWNAFLLE